MNPKLVVWSPEARQLRALDREVALKILRAIDQYLTDGVGDVKKLQPPRDELRLHIGDYRIFFYELAPLSVHIVGVKHRSDAYK